MHTVLCQDPDDMARQIAIRIRDFSLREQPRPFNMALSGGSTPQRLYRALAGPEFRDAVRWDRLEFFFGDERAVGPEHPDSNYRMANEALLGHVPVTAHRMAAERDDAAAYEQLLHERVPAGARGVPSLDLILLGIGTDGHTASLFPGTEALQDREHLVVMNHVRQLHTRRMTLTYPLINAAQRVWILAAGADKAEIVEQCFSARPDPEAWRRWPVLGAQPVSGELLWWLDRAAAGMS